MDWLVNVVSVILNIRKTVMKLCVKLVILVVVKFIVVMKNLVGALDALNLNNPI